MIIKNKKELEILREGGKRLAAVLNKAANNAIEGVTTRELNDLAESLILKSGGAPSFKGYKAQGAPHPYPDALCVSINEEVVHGLPAGRKLKNGDIGFAIQKYLKSEGFGVVRELVGHGVGRAVHEDPEIPNWGKRGVGPELVENMIIALDPMATEGGYKVKLSKDGWTWLSCDGSRSAHFDHTLVVTKGGAEVLTLL